MAITSSAGMRPLAMTSAPTLLMAATNGAAQLFSHTKRATTLPGSMSEAAWPRSSSSSRPDETPWKIARSSVPSLSKSAISISVKVPSTSRLTARRSRIRMRPSVDQIDYGGEALSIHSRFGKFQRQIVDRAQGHILISRVQLSHAPPPTPTGRALAAVFWST
jgi:hypothetical protein